MIDAASFGTGLREQLSFTDDLSDTFDRMVVPALHCSLPQ